MTTVRDIIDQGVQQFTQANLCFGHGVNSAWDEVVFLVLHSLQLPLNTSREILKRKLTSEECEKIEALLRRRVVERKPLAYLINEAWFAKMPFYVDERVLIPRSPLAELIEQQLALWIDPHQVRRILDIGTGSGCIALACAHYFPEAIVDATDVSSAALQVAAINLAKHQLSSRVNLIQADIFPLERVIYDIIISNPPYVGEQELAELPAEYQHEPQMGLAAGKEGLVIIERILHHAARYLSPHGILVVEVGNTVDELLKKFPQVPFLWPEFARGESEVFILTKTESNKYF